MKERKNYKLPAELWNDGEPKQPTLPDFLTIIWFSSITSDFCEVEIHPERALDFMLMQQELHGHQLNWEII